MVVATRAERDSRILRVSVALVWLATGLGVLHPFYRTVGASYLDRLGLPSSVMVGTCVFEVGLALWVARVEATRIDTLLQAALVLGFTAILALMEPSLLVHPYGMLSKNLPLLAVLGTAFLLVRDGWSPRAEWLLRLGVALIWITEGVFPKILFQTEVELAIVRGSGLVPMDASLFLMLLGGAQAASGLLALALRGRALLVLLGAQAVALVLLPTLVSWQDPLLWFHPFGPMTKNLPILVGTMVLIRRCSSRS